MNEKPQRPIRLLPPALRNQISAGEVVERPSSALKELMENSIDAGASSIAIVIEDGGQTLLSVKDDGCGIPASDLELAVTRHATSKISSIEELTQVSSYGFRGEALPSIASVACMRVESAYTQGNSTNEGAFLDVDFGIIKETGPSSIHRGTLITIRDLFANVPARLKFLKTPSTELKRCQEVFTRLALAQPDIAFSFTSGGKELVHIPAGLPLTQRLAKIWPPQIIEGMVPFLDHRHGVKVHGLASLPQNAQAKGDRILLYVNNRPVNDKLLLGAVRTAYKGMLTSREFPQILLFLEVPPLEVDVNAHPAKTEVRFREERHIFSAVLNALQSAIAKNLSLSGATHLNDIQPDGMQRPQAVYPPLYTDENTSSTPSHFEHATPSRPPRPQLFWGSLDAPRILDTIGKNYLERDEDDNLSEQSASKKERANFHQPHPPFSSSSSFMQEDASPYIQDDQSLSKNRDPFGTIDTSAPLVKEQSSPSSNNFSSGLPVQVGPLLCFGQIAKTYLIIKEGEELVLLDQHAAHERILVNQLEKGNQKGQSQLLVLPEKVTLHTAEIDRFHLHSPALAKMGYLLELFDEENSHSLLVRGLPFLLPHAQSLEVLKNILLDRTEGFDDIFHMMACHAAIKAGQDLTGDEIAALLTQWINTPDRHFCPHGRPITIRLSVNELEKMFKRKIN